MDNKRLEYFIRSKCIRHQILFSDFKQAFLSSKAILNGENVANIFLNLKQIGFSELRSIKRDCDLIIKEQRSIIKAERKARRKKPSP
jgi:hypothetical protein